jgi:hypothetical protein
LYTRTALVVSAFQFLPSSVLRFLWSALYLFVFFSLQNVELGYLPNYLAGAGSLGEVWEIVAIAGAFAASLPGFVEVRNVE